MQEELLKGRFAAFLLEAPNKELDAALKIYPSEKDRGKACQIAFSWPKDPFVIAEMQRLRETTEYEDPELPSKKRLIAMAMEVYSNQFTPPKEKNAAIKLIADLQGFIVKAESLDINNRRMPTAPVYKIVNE